MKGSIKREIPDQENSRFHGVPRKVIEFRTGIEPDGW